MVMVLDETFPKTYERGFYKIKKTSLKYNSITKYLAVILRMDQMSEIYQVAIMPQKAF